MHEGMQWESETFPVYSLNKEKSCSHLVQVVESVHKKQFDIHFL